MASPEKSFQNDLEALRADIAALTDTVGRLATEASKAQAAMTRTVKQAAKQTTGLGEELWEEGVHLGHDAADAAVDAAQAGVSTLEKQIKRNPVSSVLVALGIGFVVGILGHK